MYQCLLGFMQIDADISVSIFFISHGIIWNGLLNSMNFLSDVTTIWCILVCLLGHPGCAGWYHLILVEKPGWWQNSPCPEVRGWFAFSVLLQCVTYESRRLLSLFQFCFYWMCEFQVSKVFDVNSSLEKRLDTMAVSYDFVLPHDLQHQQRQKLLLVSVVSHIFGAYFSVAVICSRFCWLQSGMEQKFPISCLSATAWRSAVLFFLCSKSLVWDRFYSFLYSPSPIPWFIVIGIAPLLHVDTVFFAYEIFLHVRKFWV